MSIKQHNSNHGCALGPLPRAAAALALALLLATGAGAQTWPSRPVHVIVAFAPGGTIDALARILAQKLSERWGQSVIVDNRGGAAGNLGALAVAQAPADGTTLHLGAQSLATNVTIAPVPGFDPVKAFAPIILVATAQDVLMVPLASGDRTLAELIADAKAHPGALNYASLGTGSSGHLATVLFAREAGIKVEHVPYTTISQGVTDLVAGRLSFWLATLGGHIGNIQAGRVRALAVSGEARAAALPDVPTFRESGFALEESTWFGLFAPNGTPATIIDKVNADVAAVLAESDMRARGGQLGFRYIGGAPAQLGEHLRTEIAKWAEVAKSADLSGH